MISQREYQERRRKLAQKLPQGAIAIIPAADEVVRNGDAHYRFRQDSDFYYLTGFNEPEALLLIVAGEKNEDYLFNRPRNPAQEQWTGRRLGQEGACKELNMTAAYAIETLAEHLPEFLTGKTAVYYAIGRYPAYEKHVLQALHTL